MDRRSTFSDSNDISGSSSSICCVVNPETASPPPPSTEVAVAALRRLSDNLECIFDSSAATSPEKETFSDACIVLSSGESIAVHRCILAARSSFFRVAFAAAHGGDSSKVKMAEVAGDVEVRYEAIVEVVAYLYSGKVRAFRRNMCACVDEECDHVACRPSLEFMLEVLYASFVFQISELVFLYQRHLLDIINRVGVDDIPTVLRTADICGRSCKALVTKCIELAVRYQIEYVVLEKLLSPNMVNHITKLQSGLDGDGIPPRHRRFPHKYVRRIHRALDSDDVELVRMLLKEGNISLDDAHALHYAVAYCDSKTTTELLDMGLGDVNCRNYRGYTVLHVAAIRREPKVIVSLLTKGARFKDLTPDGRKAVQIAKRVTRAVDYYKCPQEGKPTPKDRLCIEILEQTEMREPLSGEASLSLAIAGEDLRMKLLYLENRVGLAKLLFPVEAKVAMDIAQVDGTMEFSLADASSRPLSTSSRKRRSTPVDLNDPPFQIKDEHLLRMKALSKTVELGKRFFPRCSEVLNKIMDAEDLSELAFSGVDTVDDKTLRKRRFMELQDVLSKAFHEDTEEFGGISAISSSSSASPAVLPSTNLSTTRPTKMLHRK